MGPVHKSYTAKEKLTVIAYAEVHGNRAAQREMHCFTALLRATRPLGATTNIPDGINLSNCLKCPNKSTSIFNTSNYNTLI